MFAPKSMRKKIAAEQAAKQKAASDKQAKINKSMLIGLKKPTSDNTYVKGPNIKNLKDSSPYYGKIVTDGVRSRINNKKKK